MRSLRLTSGYFLTGLLLICSAGLPARGAEPSDPNVAGLDRILAEVKPRQKSVAVGDMIFDVSLLQAWRDHLAAGKGYGTESAFDGSVNLWPSGIVYYAFDASVSAAHQRSFVDAANEWSAFANVSFVLRTNQINYVLVKDGGAGLSGGNSFVGMKNPGPQDLNIGSYSWNRDTITHEVGHVLGLVHEHQRSDRDNYVNIIAANIPGGASNGNFILLPSSNNIGLYDFLSVMHYAKNFASTNAVPPGNTIEPKPAYAQYLDLMGNQFDRVLSASDRNGMSAVYGAPAATPGPVVTNTKDSGPGSLRTSIYYAIDHPGTTISLHIPMSDSGLTSGGAYVMKFTDGLPRLGVQTTIDGASQTTYGGDSNGSGPEVMLDGSLAQDSYPDGVKFTEANCTVRGLIINGFRGNGAHFTGAGATGNSFSGCYIGTNADGTSAVQNPVGVLIEAGAQNNLIGGPTAALRNVISGNQYQGVVMRDSGTANNFAQGNYIGLNAAGTAALPNGNAGIYIFAGAHGNTIGGAFPGARNVISGNSNQGIAISDAGTSANLVAGNYIGLNATGAAAVANSFAGVEIYGGATGNTIGGTSVAARNVISGNSPQGIAISGTGSTSNVALGNYIGTNFSGASAVPNGYSGVGIFNGASNNTIGGTVAGAGNLISGNSAQGVYLSDAGTNSNVVAGNLIGTTAAGMTALANSYAGVEISNGAQLNLIGGFTAGARNILSGNSSQGVLLGQAGTSNNRVAGNYIGTNFTGTAALPNGFPGVDISGGASANTIGGAEVGAGNVISGNNYRGLSVVDSGTNNNLIAGNLIGVNAAGTAALANSGPGIAIFGGAQNTAVGSINGGRNFIAGNNGAGIAVSGLNTNATSIIGNSIGLTPAGAVVANTAEGVAIFADGSGSPQSNTIGGASVGAANTISGNGGAGVALYNNGTISNRVSGNSIQANGGLGLDLWGDGVTPNDTGDGDAGPNNLQNFPVLTSAVLGINTAIAGSLNSTANTTFRVEFFASATADSSGFGEGQHFIGAISVTTNGSGNASFSQALTTAVPAGRIVSATATDPAGNTSEFSRNVLVTTTDTDGDGMPDSYEAANGLSTTVNDAAADADGDGLTNLAEFRAGTDPRSATSVFRLSEITRNGTSIQISLPTVNGRTYRVEYSSDLGAASSWRTLADEVAGTGAKLLFADTGAIGLTRRFYRAVIEP